MSGEFNVWAFDEQGYHTKVANQVDARAAVRVALVNTEAMQALGFPTPYRVIIEDGGGFTCFEWIRGKGVTFGASMEDAPP